MLVEFFKKVKEDGGQATLTATTNSGQIKIKFEIVSPRSAPAPTPLQPVPGQPRYHHLGAASKERQRQRAANHQGTDLAGPTPVSPPHPVSGEAGAPAGPLLSLSSPFFPLSPQDPSSLLPSPSPSSGRRWIMSVGRLPVPSFASLSLDELPPQQDTLVHQPLPSRKPSLACHLHLPRNHL